MNQENNHLAYSLNVWLTISVLAPILNFISDLVIGNSVLELKDIGILFAFICVGTSLSLPLYFLLKKISKTIYNIKIPNPQVRLLITLVVFFFIIATHILFFNKTLHQVSSLGSESNYYLRYSILTIQLAKYYLLTAAISIWYFKIERKTYIPKNEPDAEILDDILDF